jgi:hypothetical protein
VPGRVAQYSALKHGFYEAFAVLHGPSVPRCSSMRGQPKVEGEGEVEDGDKDGGGKVGKTNEAE